MTADRSRLAALASAALGLALLGGAGAAQARSDVYWSVGVGVPGVVVGASSAAPVYYTPPPVYYTPPPPVYHMPPAYRSPRPVYYGPPAVIISPRPPAYYHHGHRGHRGGRHHGGGHRNWR